MNKDFTNYTKSYFIIIAVILLSVSIFVLFTFSLMPLQKVVERKVMINSHQYIESENAAVAIMRAAIAGINSRLTRGDLTQNERANLEAQLATLNVQLYSIIQ